MLILGWDEFAVKVEGLVNQGLRLIEDGLGITFIEMFIQLCATLVLFLVVRFFVWNKVTAILDARKKVISDSLKERDNALEESKKLKEESAQILKQNSQREAWQNMARQVAHEIKNPLTPMQLKTQFILREYNSGNVSQQKMNTYFATMLEQINSLSEIASSFSQLSQIGSSDSDVEDLIIIINNVLALYQNTEDVEISFIHNLQENQAFVFINKTQLIRVFNNLIKNSIQAKKDNEDNFVKIILKIFKKILSYL